MTAAAACAEDLDAQTGDDVSRPSPRRAVDLRAAERAVADCLQDRLEPEGVGVVIEAQHQCMSARGARSHGSQAVTSAVRGRLRHDTRTRQEFFSLTGIVR